MVVGFHGADPAQLRRLGAQMGSSGQMLLSQLATLGAGVAQAPWPGPDAERFRHDWQSSHSRTLRQAAAFLSAAGQELVRNAAEQEQASQAGGAGMAAGGPPTPSAAPKPADLEGKAPAQIRSWWDRLTAEQRTAFITEHPVLAGNTNGIPFDDRIRANAINAQHRIDWLGSSDPEPKFNPLIMAAGYPAMYAKEHEAWAARQSGADYLQRVVDGKITLVAYDPQRSAIVEMIGAYDADTTTAVTYVPGTRTNEQSFYGGGPQSVAQWLVGSDTAKGTVAFVYKGTEFPDGAFAEAFFDEAKSDDFVAATAPVLRDFQAAVELEKPAGAQAVAVGHSWGLRNVAGSETAGAHYDKVIALSGAAMPPGWTADPDTHYSSYTYPDILLTAELSGVVGDNYPMKEPAFEKHVYTPREAGTGRRPTASTTTASSRRRIRSMRPHWKTSRGKFMRGSSRWSPLARIWCAPLAISLFFGLSGCGAGSGTQESETMSSVTLETAKSKLLAVQHEIIEMVPADLVVSVFENDTSSLMPCRGEQKKWVGTGQVELRPGLDRTRFLDEVRDSLSGRTGWSATDGTDNDGNRRVDVLHDDGTQLLVSFWDGPESLRIGSFSACFEFPEYQYGEKY